MALWMEVGSEPKTDAEKADLEAITALKESAALELKEKGNGYVKKGKKHYLDAIDCYTRAIKQGVLSVMENSILFSNRAHVNLLLGNHRRAMEDANEAIRLCPTNVKALYRAVKASLSLNLLPEANEYCERGLEQDPTNEELKKLAKQVKAKKLEQEEREAEVLKAVAEAKGLLSAFGDRGLKIGKAMFRELTGLRKPFMDQNNILHWPVLILYPEVMSSDCIEDFCETDMFSTHLDMMFCEDSPPLPWDKGNSYTRDAIEVYHEAGSCPQLSKTGILHYLLEGTAGANVENCIDDDKDLTDQSKSGSPDGSSRLIRVNTRRTLHEVLKEPNFIIPEIPVFYVVSKRSSFYKDFKSGRWSLPS